MCAFPPNLIDAPSLDAVCWLTKGVKDSRQHVLHLKMVNASDKGQPLMVEVAGMPAVGTAAKISLLHAATYPSAST